MQTSFFVCFLKHFVLNCWCSWYSCLSLWRHVFTRGNSNIAHLRDAVFLTVFPQWRGCKQETYQLSVFLSSAAQFLLGEAVMCTQLLPMQIEQMPPQRSVLPAWGGAWGNKGATKEQQGCEPLLWNLRLFKHPMLKGAQESDHSSSYFRVIKSEYYWKSSLNYRPYSLTSPSAKS